MNKETFTRAGFEPATSGLTCRHVPTEITSPILSISLGFFFFWGGGGGASQKLAQLVERRHVNAEVADSNPDVVNFSLFIQYFCLSKF